MIDFLLKNESNRFWSDTGFIGLNGMFACKLYFPGLEFALQDFFKLFLTNRKLSQLNGRSFMNQ